MVCSFSLLGAGKARFIGEPLSIEGTGISQEKFPEIRKKYVEPFRPRLTTEPAGCSLDFAEF
jgi:hypothetical protein